MSLTRTSRRPCSDSIRATRPATAAGSSWSTTRAVPCPPVAAMRSPVSSIVSGRPISDLPAARLLRPVAYTCSPARASSTAMARPAPRVAPATSATGWALCSVSMATMNCHTRALPGGPLVEVALEPGGQAADRLLELGQPLQTGLAAEPHAGVGHHDQALNHHLP